MGLHRPPSAGAFVLPTAAVWLFLALAVAVVISRGSAAVEATFAPWLLFPLLVGLLLGLCLTWLLRWCECGHRGTAIVGTLLAALLLVAGQHLWHYQKHLDAMRAAKREIIRQGPAFAQVAGNLQPVPPTFREFLEHEAARGRKLWPGHIAQGPAAWASWGLDGLLLTAAALGVVLVALRRPYCNSCRSWYRLVWEGPLDPRRSAAARAAGLLPEGVEPNSGRIVTWSCRGGCQPARVDLSWREKSAAGKTVTRRTQTWLSPGQVLELAQIEPALAPQAPPNR